MIKWRDKKWFLGYIVVPVAVPSVLAFAGWVLVKSPSQHSTSNQNSIVNFSNGGISSQGQTGGNNTINNITQQHSFSETQRIIMAPQFLGGNMVLDLDNLATLTAWPPPTRERVTLMLHFIAVPPAMECVSVTKEGCENLRNSNVFKVVTSHGPIYSFDTNHPRHEIPVAGRTFVVTLKEINNVDIAGLSHPFEVVFGISEK